MKKLDLVHDVQLYYKERGKFEKSFVGRISHNQRLRIHPLLLKIISYRNKQAGFTIRTIYDRRGTVSGSKIFCVTHIGKHDVEAVSEVIKDHWYLLSGDFENMKGTVEEKFLGLNGVVYIREDDKADRKLSKEKMIQILKNGGNMLYFPEGTWNLSPNLPVLQCTYGIIDVAMRFGAMIIPIGIKQYDKLFISAVGEPFDVSVYHESEKTDAISDLRGILAGLKMDIWVNAPQKYKETVHKEEFDNIINKKISEWTQPRQVLLDGVFKPKGQAEPEEVFEHLRALIPSRENAFLLREIMMEEKKITGETNYFCGMGT